MMNPQFMAACHEEMTERRCNFLSYVGEPLLYDMGAYVNRTIEEIKEYEALTYKMLQNPLSRKSYHKYIAERA